MERPGRSGSEWPTERSAEPLEWQLQRVAAAWRGAVLGRAPDHAGLEALARAQGGCFALDQCSRFGLSGSLVRAHVAAGRYERLARGVFAFAAWPASPLRRHAAAWLAARRCGNWAVVAGPSALEVHGVWPQSHPVVAVTYLVVGPRAARRRRPRGAALSFGGARQLLAAVPGGPELPGVPVVAIDAAVEQSVGLVDPDVLQAVRGLARLHGRWPQAHEDPLDVSATERGGLGVSGLLGEGL